MGKIEDSVRPLALKVAEEKNCELYDVEYKKEGKDWYLRIFIDKNEGIGVDDCENYSREISPLLDKEDPIKENYILEVSSPGMFRKLKTKQHFEKYIGSEIEVKLIKSEDGKKTISGTLLKYDDGTVFVETESGQVEVNKEKYMYVKLNPKCF